MLITQTRIRTLENHIPELHKGKKIRLQISMLDQHLDGLQNIGFTQPFALGQAVLPRKTMGPVARFNTEGLFLPQKDQPKETHYRSQVWTHTEYH
jgi:hypothetical protein